MAAFNRNAFIQFVIENHVIGFFDRPLKLRSGRESHWYANWRTASGDVFLVDRLTDFLIDFLEDRNIVFDIIYGVPDGATKVGLIAQHKWAARQKDYSKGSHVLLMGRSIAKMHGMAKDRYFLGDAKGRIVVVEDVTTTGGSLIKAIESLKEAEATVVAAIGLTNRMERRDDGKSVAEAVARMDVPYYAMSDASELLPKALVQSSPSDSIRLEIEKEFEQFGVEPLKLV